MSKKIYALPINAAFDQDCACPLCDLENGLDTEAVEYTLGAAMMEPDFRVITNKKGFCKRHFARLSSQGNALSLALMMQSQSEWQNNRFKAAPPAASKGIFRKSTEKQAAIHRAQEVADFVSSCAVCEKVENTMVKFFENVVYLWKTDKDFRQKCDKSAFCLPHFATLTRYAADGLNDAEFRVFYSTLLDAQTARLDACYRDVSEFTRLFDHRSGGAPTERVKNALKRCIHMYGGVTQTD
ncbi:MAG: DUF6062 family protein [Clostridiales bacterium]|nr:DUF6062 family protein [Clostridiales bacterium]